MQLAALSGIVEHAPLGLRKPLGLAAVFLAFVLLLSSIMNTEAQAETRTLKMYFTHTKERATITFKKNGKYVSSGLRKANRFLRDWRRKEPTRMDPALLDLVWEVYQKSGSRKPIHVISGYRSPRTNKMLRRRGRKVATKSQHTLGKALDFFMPDVSVAKLRALGLKAHRGGVGYYRGSFVHLDTGRVRHWPRMSKRQLSRVFPRGQTIHVPSNGRALKGYKVALANLKKGRNADGSKRSTTVRRTLLASIFSGGSNGRDEDEGENVKIAKAAPKKPKPAKPVAVAAAQPKKAKGPDPFSLESNAAKKAADLKEKRLALAQQKEAEEAEKLAKEVEEKLEAEKAQVASLVPERVTVPRSRPTSNQRVETQLAALAPAQEPLLEPIRATELALATLPASGRVLRPSVDVPEQNQKPALSPVTVPAPGDVASIQPSASAPKAAVAARDLRNLNSRIESALARGRVAPVDQPAAQRESNALLASALKSVPIPRSPSARPEVLQLALAAAPVEKAKQILATATPQWRTSSASGETVAIAQPTKPSLRVPVPNRVDSGSSSQAIATGAQTPMISALKLGDLDSKSVKKWAVASSTRVGPVAGLMAPNYKQGSKRAVPNSVYSAGFAFTRSPLRADRFSGKSLTRVAFAYVGSL